MIGYLKGRILHKERRGASGQAILDVSNVGYRVSMPLDAFNALHEGNDVEVWVYTAVREDALDLYGFADKETLAFFELLITISGIGPKSALGILSAAPLSSLRQAVISGETTYLTKISGIGKKIAEKIVLELKDKVAPSEAETATGAATSGDVDAVEALQALGYTQKEARDALEGISRDIKDAGEKVKAALRILGK